MFIGNFTLRLSFSSTYSNAKENALANNPRCKHILEPARERQLHVVNNYATPFVLFRVVALMLCPNTEQW